MTSLISVRDLDRADLPFLRIVLDRTGLFPSELLEPMVEPYLTRQAAHQWLVACRGDDIAGFTYAEPERMTDGTFNLLAIAVDPTMQRIGIGAMIVRALEDVLRGAGGRVLLVDTSSLPEYAGTRAFYARLAFVAEARIRDFYAAGDDKIVFWKQL